MTSSRTSIGRRRRSASLLAAAVAIFSVTAVAATAQVATPVTTQNKLRDTGNGAQGVGQINQNAGDNNNQANATVVSLSRGDDTAALARVIGGSVVLGAVLDGHQTLQDNTIADSFNNYTGIAQINQSTGGANAQLNAIALAFAPGAAFSSSALTDVELALVGDPPDDTTPSSALPDSANHVTNSFTGFTGIAQVQQVAGDHNLVTNVVAVAFGVGS